MTAHRSRRGLVSAVVLVTLLVIGIIGAGLLRAALSRRGEAMAEERKLQAESLAEAGLGRAAARLDADPNFAGETWDVPASDLGGRGAGRVAIRVEPIADAPNRRTVSVQAEYPAGSTYRARRSRSAAIELRPTPAAEETRP
ncbi:hypothetical protein TA3x_003684 [Tundrisphaera sp. TA3]|uniref:hypothetical protein n=1 Tax=Tundrisphaera sp. TA3 TaxID=3435775 RepID=UPI003EBF80A4